MEPLQHGKFIVRCRVSGGVTGTREGIVKKDGEYLYFDTMEEASQHAKHYRNQANGPHATAHFEYWADKT